MERSQNDNWLTEAIGKRLWQRLTDENREFCVSRGISEMSLGRIGVSEDSFNASGDDLGVNENFPQQVAEKIRQEEEKKEEESKENAGKTKRIFNFTLTPGGNFKLIGHDNPGCQYFNHFVQNMDFYMNKNVDKIDANNEETDEFYGM